MVTQEHLARCLIYSMALTNLTGPLSWGDKKYKLEERVIILSCLLRVNHNSFNTVSFITAQMLPEVNFQTNPTQQLITPHRSYNFIMLIAKVFSLFPSPSSPPLPSSPLLYTNIMFLILIFYALWVPRWPQGDFSCWGLEVTVFVPQIES